MMNHLKQLKNGEVIMNFTQSLNGDEENKLEEAERVRLLQEAKKINQMVDIRHGKQKSKETSES